MEIVESKEIVNKGSIPNDWQIWELHSLSEFITKGSTPTTYGFEWVDSGVVFLRSECVSERGIELGAAMFISDAANQMMKRSAIYANDILMTITGNVGRVCKVPEGFPKANINQHIARIRIPNNQVDREFIYQFLKQDKIRNNYLKITTGQAYPQISLEQVRNTKIPLPPLTEQRAIAACLSTWDKAIAKTEALIAQKELQKKWLMQQLLTGKKRLKGFVENWKEYHLGSLGDTYTGLTGKNKDDFGDGKPYIPYMNIFSNAQIDISNLDFVQITDADNQNRVKYGDIFFTISSETSDEVGMASVLLDDIGEVYLNSFCFGFRLYDFNTLVPEFSSYFLRADEFRSEIYKLSQGATRFNLSKNNLMKLYIILPPSEEQTAIAQVLQTADKEINMLKTEVENLREQKKWLMQELLTGKKRLKFN